AVAAGPHPVERLNRLCLEYVLEDTIQESMPTPDSVRRFYSECVEPELKADFSFWGWLGAGVRQSALAANHYQRVKGLAAPAHQGMLDRLWEWLQVRREMDLEYRLHRIARLWVGFHKWAAWLLFVLAADHIVASFRFGGY